MDEERELGRAKLAMGALVVVLFSGWMSYDELALYVNGRDADAEVTKAMQEVSSRRRLYFEFAFTEPDGTRRTGTTYAREDDPPQFHNGKLAVRYTPGKNGNVRPAGRVNWIAITVFGASMCVVLFVIVKLLREANDDAPRRKRR